MLKNIFKKKQNTKFAKGVLDKPIKVQINETEMDINLQNNQRAMSGLERFNSKYGDSNEKS